MPRRHRPAALDNAPAGKGGSQTREEGLSTFCRLADRKLRQRLAPLHRRDCPRNEEP
ncbi:MAG TPA: hypothetical protein VMS38_27925 [Pseudorhodoferax sp.]|nr:hypothetical protein [Pseudorhodoferax sp.]